MIFDWFNPFMFRLCRKRLENNLVQGLGVQIDVLTVLKADSKGVQSMH